ncbi:MAG: DUF2782 domain-containing protein [Gammaproteobacteria bacterium]
MNTSRLTILPVVALLAASAAADLRAQEKDPAAPPPLPEPQPRSAPPAEDVPIPPKIQDERSRLEPTVEIRRDEEENIIEEYSLEGRVYMVKVTPKKGPPYYYLDDDGDGQLELSERDRAAYPVTPVYWKIKEWQ